MSTVDRQIQGAIVLVLMINIVYLGRVFLFYENPMTSPRPPYSEERKGYKAVELAGDTDARGIYFVPANTTLSRLLDIADIGDRKGFDQRELNRILENGDRVTLPSGRSPQGDQRTGKIGNAKRYVLDMPINVNTARLEELTLIPGIGEKTAEAILEARKELGGFKNIEDIMLVRGIGEKKLRIFRNYLYVERKSDRGGKANTDAANPS
ncbi:MAG: ComEA family DNA-binding protein [Syntrophales bacterium]